MDYVKMSPEEILTFLRCLTKYDLDDYEIEVDGKVLESMTDVRHKIMELETEMDLPFTDRPECDGECPYCELEDDCRDETDCFAVPGVRAVTFNAPATIIQWEDGTKTVVKCAKGQKFDQYSGFCAAVCKKLFGSTANAISIMDYFDTGRIARERAEQKEKEAEENRKAAQKAKIDKELRKLHKYMKDVEDEVYRRVVTEAADRKYKLIRKMAKSDDTDKAIDKYFSEHEVSED